MAIKYVHKILKLPGTVLYRFIFEMKWIDYVDNFSINDGYIDFITYISLRTDSLLFITDLLKDFLWICYEYNELQL